MFTQLHLHTHFSLLDGISSSYQYAERAVEYNHSSLAITDHGRMTGVYNHQQACKKYDIKPIFGVEMYLVDQLETFNDKNKRQRDKTNHIILLAENEVGYKNLLYLNYLSMKDDQHFYYTNRILQSELFENSEGIIVGTACMGSKWGRLLSSGKEKEAKDLYKQFVDHFKENFYTEVQLNELNYEMEELKEGQKSVNDFLIDQANLYGVPVVLSGDVHYIDKGQDALQTVSIAIRNKATIDNLNFEIESKQLYYHDERDYINFNKEFGYNYNEQDINQWVNNTQIIANKCNYRIPERRKMYIPSITENDDETLVKLSRNALSGMFGDNIPVEYKKRLNHELEVLLRKGFSSYILILKDMVDYVLSEGYMVGVGRGCFTENSLVKIPNNLYKRIKDISEGDIVIAGTGKERMCLETYEYDINEKIVELELENGEKIECTLDHKILILPKGKKDYSDGIWKSAKDLTEDDNIIKV